MRAGDVLDWLADAAPATTAGDDRVILALIGLAGIVLSALISGYFGTRGERIDRARTATGENGPPAPTSPPAPGDPDAGLVAELRAELAEAREAVDDERRQRDAAVHEAENADRLLDEAHRRVDVLERALVLRGFAPWRFVTGEEADADARPPIPPAARPRPRA